jgi:hypothetical protein
MRSWSRGLADNRTKAAALVLAGTFMRASGAGEARPDGSGSADRRAPRPMFRAAAKHALDHFALRLTVASRSISVPRPAATDVF